MTEIWKPVVGWEGLYEVSDQGRIRSLTRTVRARYHRPLPARLMEPGPNQHGYMVATLSREGRKARRLVHRLVLEAFVGPRPVGCETRHLDNDRTNNRLANLAWGTPVENAADKVVHGTTNRGQRCGSAKLTEADVLEIRGSATTNANCARRYGVSSSTIHRVRTGKTWFGGTR